MSSASDQLQAKLSNQENEKKRNSIFLSEIAALVITWTAIAATYASLQSEASNTAAWGAIMFALFGLQVGLAAWKVRN
jgi:purine-cytosine permease-like protein